MTRTYYSELRNEDKSWIIFEAVFLLDSNEKSHIWKIF